MPKTSSPIRANQLPLIRAELSQWLTDPGPFGGPETWSRGFDPEGVRREREAAAAWSVSLRAAQLDYVAADMSRLAHSAGLALPSYRLHPEDLPAPHGLVVWEEPVTDVPGEGGELINGAITAATWAVRGSTVRIRVWGEREEWLRLMAQGDPRLGLADMTPRQVAAARARYPYSLVSMAESRLPFGKIPGWLQGSPSDTSGMSMIELEDLARHSTRVEQAERALIVTWLLMGQTLATVSDVEATRSAHQHIRRIDPGLLTAVRLVQLRHRSTGARPQSDGQGSGVNYRHRWMVHGHWRNVYNQSLDRTRPFWIPDHFKGPDGAPLLDPGKLVNALRR